MLHFSVCSETQQKFDKIAKIVKFTKIAKFDRIYNLNKNTKNFEQRLFNLVRNREIARNKENLNKSLKLKLLTMQ